MAVAFGTLGTISLGIAAATTDVARPASVAAGDLQVMVAAVKIGPLTQPVVSGWTAVGMISHGSTASGNDVGSMRMHVWVREAPSAETAAVTITWGTTPTAGQAFIYRLTKSSTMAWDLGWIGIARTATTSAWSAAFANARDAAAAGDFVSVINAVPSDLVTASSAGTLTSTNLTPGAATARIAHQVDAGGAQSAVWFDSFEPTAGTSSVSLTYASTLTGGGTTNVVGVSAMLRAREVARARVDVDTITSGLLARFRADSIGQANGSAVNSWAALSGSVAGTVLNGTVAPTYTTNSLNGQPGVTFNGTSHYMSVSDGGGGGTIRATTGGVSAITTVAICQRTGTNAATRILTQISTVLAADPRHLLGQPATIDLRVGGRRLDVDGTTAANTNGTIKAVPVVIIAETNYANTEMRHWQDGALRMGVAGPGTGTTQATTSAAWTLGANSAGAEFWSGVVYEVFYFNRVLTAAERQSIDSYAQDRYAIGVTDYVAPTAVPAGTATGTFTYAGTASGSAPANGGTASGTLAYAGTAAGSSDRAGSASGTLAYVGTATGTSARSGSGSGTFAYAGTAAGTSAREGTASGTFAYVGTAAGTTTRSGSASGTFTYVGSASGASDRAGTGTGTLAYAGTATGSAPAIGAATGSGTGTFTYTGTASGASARSGSATGTLAYSGTASGTTTKTGTASGTVTYTGTAAGTSARSGSGSGTLTYAGTATGTTTRSGSASGTLSYTGTASGTAAPSGVGSGTLAYTGTATGSTAKSGSSSGTTSYTGTATGSSARSGTAVGAWAYVGTATGSTTRSGTASGALAYTGTATGAGPANAGTAAGAWAYAGTASGTADKSGTASGTLGYAGTATGSTTRSGSATGTYGYSGTAQGQSEPVGTAVGSFDYLGTAVGGQLRDLTIAAALGIRAITATLGPSRHSATLGTRDRTATLERSAPTVSAVGPRRITTSIGEP